MFHHISHPTKFLNELNRVLKKDGGCILIEPHDGLISRFIAKNIHKDEYYDTNELEWDKKERDMRADLEGESIENKLSRPEESTASRANPQTGVGADVERGVFSSDHLDTGYGKAADIRRVVLYEGLRRDPRTGQSVATASQARQYMNPGQVLERTITLEGHIEIDKFSVEMMALEDVVILRDLCNDHLNSMVKKVSIIK